MDLARQIVRAPMVELAIEKEKLTGASLFAFVRLAWEALFRGFVPNSSTSGKSD